MKTLLLVLALAGGPTAAVAGEPPAAVSPSGAGGARLHFSRGAALYGAGRYAEAALEFEAARALEALPAIDYDLAILYDRMGRPREAADAYGRFVAAVPGDRDAPAARARIAELRRQVASSPPIAPAPALAPAPAAIVAPALAPAPAAVVAPDPSAHVDTPPLRRPIYPWIVGGAGAAIFVGSLAAGLVAHARYGDLRRDCAPDGACDAVAVPSAQRWIDEGRAAGLAADVLLGVGAATVAAGVALYFVEGCYLKERRAAWAAPVVDSRGGALALGGAW